MKALAVKHGWKLSHTTGSHGQYYHATLPGPVTIAGADHIELPKGTEQKLRKQITGK